MAYNILLKNMIDESGLTYKDIAGICKSNGKSIDPSYISKLVNKKADPPSDEITKAIALACNSDADDLIIEAYIEKSPTAVIEAFENIRSALVNIAINMTDKQYEEAIRATYQELPFAQILKTFKNDDNSLLSPTEINQPSGIKIKASDDGMNPIIIKGANVNIETQSSYSDGDIVAIPDNNNEMIFRKYYSMHENKIMFQAHNPIYSPIIVDKSQAIIIGKATSVFL